MEFLLLRKLLQHRLESIGGAGVVVLLQSLNASLVKRDGFEVCRASDWR
jgi:hypothetical protein